MIIEGSNIILTGIPFTIMLKKRITLITLKSISYKYIIYSTSFFGMLRIEKSGNQVTNLSVLGEYLIYRVLPKLR